MQAHKQQDELVGTIDRYLFQNHENGYAVFLLATRNAQPITVTGYVHNIHPGEQVALQGSWSVHPKFGKQFQADSISSKPPSSLNGLAKYLSSGLIKGIGKVYAQKMVTKFGESILEIIDKQPQRLLEIEGIGQGRVEKIIEGWKQQKDISSIMVFLQEKGVSPAYATKIYKQYGQLSCTVLKENPYRLADEIWGIGFKIADQIAQNLGFELFSTKRIKAGTIFAISSALSQGNLYIELTELKKKSFELLELDATEHEKSMKIALHELYNEDKIKLISDREEHFVTLSKYYFSEKGVAVRLKKLITKKSIHQFDIDALYKQLRTTTGNAVELNEDQQHGILTCLQHKVTIITGGPGTGKTTLIRKLLDLLDAQKKNYKLAAPTGRAAKRIMEGTGRHALTLHRLLEFDFNIMGFAHNEQNALKVDFLIVDEASMIDIFLAHALIKALPEDAHLILLGDVDQLPSVGAGNFLNDLIESAQVPIIKLIHIFRQAQDSLIVTNAHRVNSGEFPTSFAPGSRHDFIFIKENEPSAVAEHLKKIYTQTLQKFHIGIDDATVLVPMHRGIVGSQSINQQLQTLLNSNDEQPSIMYAGTTFKTNDKVMQIKNNYDKSVFNGDSGTIKSIDSSEKKVAVSFDERIVEYEFDELDELVLAYAISIHKSQGSEYAAVIIPLFMQHFTLLQRNLLYTAITRAKKLCILIGQPKAIGMAIKNNKGIARKTFLKQFLTTDLACRS
jgi:exodeoxyribonuclease V alpha subunit